MKVIKVMWVGLASVLVCLPAYAQNRNGPADGTGTVNDYSASWASKARHDVSKAGYIPTVIETAQARNIFFTATRNDRIYTVVVTPDEKVYASTPLSLGKGAAARNGRNF